jgi:hypothetical protein
MVIAVAALIAALAGTAVAVDKIISKEIAANAVRSKHIKDGHVKVRDANLTKSRSAAAPRATTKGVGLDELDVTVKVRRGDRVSILGTAVADNVGGGSDFCRFALTLDGPSIDESNVYGMSWDGSGDFERRRFNGSALGTTSARDADAIELLITAGGKLSVEPAFFPTGIPGYSCEIRDRALAVTVLR